MNTARVILFVLLVIPAFASAQTQPGWRMIDPLPQTKSLRSVLCIDSATAVALGDSGTFLRTIDGGASWKVTHGLGLDAYDVRGMSFPSWPLGYAAGAGGEVFRTTDGGDTWTRRTAAGALDLNCVSFCDASNGAVAGDSVRIYRTTDGGASWVEQTHSIPQFGSLRIDRILLLSDKTGFAMVDEGILFRCSGIGSLWTMISALEGTGLNAVWFSSDTNGFVAGDNGYMFRTSDAGTTWEQIVPPVHAGLKDLCMPTRGIGYAVGTGGTILRSNNEGEEWFLEESGTAQTLHAVSFSNAIVGFAVGDSGIILKTTSGGLSEAVEPAVPGGRLFAFVSVTPHPVVPSTGTAVIAYRLERPVNVRLTIIDAVGRRVATLESNPRTAGIHASVLDTRGLPAGCYAIRASVNGELFSRPFVVIR